MNTVSKENGQKRNIYSVVKRFFHNIAWKMVQITCEHKHKYDKWENYNDRYTEYRCPTCNLTIYEKKD